MRIFSPAEFTLAGLGLMVLSLAFSSDGFALDAGKSSPAHISPTASFAPANVQPSDEPPSPVIDTAPQLVQIEGLDPYLEVGSMPENKQAKAAFKRAVKAFNDNNLERAIAFVKFAAEKRYLLAQWRLAKAFRDGIGVKRDDVKALEWFRKVADRHDPSLRRSRQKLRATVSALVALADFSRTGVENTSFNKNLSRSHSIYHYAATQYGHPGAQYQLGIMYLNGEGVEKNRRVGMRWLMLAARKGYAKAQAALGDIYLSYKDSPKYRLQGLMWYRMAERNAQLAQDEKLYARSRQIFAKASDTERELAVGMMAKMRETGSGVPGE